MAEPKPETQKFKISFKLVFSIVSLLVLLIFLAYFFGILKKTCNDETCFNEALQKCSPAKYLTLQNYNYYRYSIEGKRSDACVIRIDLVKMALGTPPDRIALFEGKGMTCKVPAEELNKIQGGKVEGILKYCSGPLKEAMYQAIIEKLYTLIVANMGEILGEIEDVLSLKPA